ncbi:MAG: NHLP bacteriocin export ABC transporter permease/ATPase subunit [Gemmataceae bacterium]
MTNCTALLDAVGVVQPLSANTPLLLDDPGSVWLIRAGSADVFAVPYLRKESGGPRRHLFRAEKGQALFGCDLSEAQPAVALIVLGMPGCEVLRVPLERYLALLQNNGQPVELIALLHDWIQALHGSMGAPPVPRQNQVLSAGATWQTEADEPVSAAGGTAWIAQREGSSALCGIGELLLRAGSPPVPLTGRAWLLAGAGSQLDAFDTRTLLQQGRLLDALAAFHVLMRRWLARSMAQRENEVHQRLVQKAKQAESIRQATMARLVAVEMDATVADLALPSDEDLLWTACFLVGQAQGIEVVADPHLRRRHQRHESIAQIARSSRFRTRRILLAPGWWQRDGGPLLAFRGSDERPVALLPVTPTSYLLEDPVTKERLPVTEELADSLQPFGYCFYRSFPGEKLGAYELLKFGMLPCWSDLARVLCVGAASGLLAMVVPVATGIVVDVIIPGAQREQLLLIVLALLATSVALAVLQLVRACAVLRIEGKLEMGVEGGLWDRLLQLPVPFFRQYTAGDLANRAMSLTAIRQILTDSTVSSLVSGIFSIFTLGLLFFYSVKLALIACLIAAFVVAVTVLLGFLRLRYHRDMYEIQGTLSGAVLQFITGIVRLRVAGAADRALGQWAQTFTRQKRLAFKAQQLGNMLAVFHAVLPILTALAIFALVAFLPDLDISTGDFLAFNAAFIQFLASTMALGTAFLSALRVVPLLERMRPILDALPEVNQDRPDPGDLNGGIEISHLSFRYQPDTPRILEDVSLQIPMGSYVAFVGPSGSGKSTLLRLLLGFETPETGSIYYDGHDLASIDVNAVRRQIGVVLQHSKVIPGDIFTNIVGAMNLTLDDAWEAARLAGLAADIEAMPMGMHTVVTEGGSTLSGGQRQRLLIARAIVARPRIIFFDEATSALDNQTQAVVSQSLQALRATRIVIAHRLSTVIHADRICVMSAGKVVQQGTYEELMQQEGLFKQLALRQLA